MATLAVLLCVVGHMIGQGVLGVMYGDGAAAGKAQKQQNGDNVDVKSKTSEMFPPHCG